MSLEELLAKIAELRRRAEQSEMESRSRLYRTEVARLVDDTALHFVGDVFVQSEFAVVRSLLLLGDPIAALNRFNVIIERHGYRR